MKPVSRFFHMLLAAAIGSAVLASAPVLAAPLFTVNENSVPGTVPGSALVVADRLSFEYQSRIEQTIVGGSLAGAGDTFVQQGFLTKAAFGSPGNGSVPSQLNANVLGFGYGMYAVFSITGEGDPLGNTGGILANFNTFTMTLYIDPSQDTSLSIPLSGAVVPVDAAGDDYAVINYTLSVGQAHVFGGLANGDFDSILNATLTPAGALFFVDPTPFFALENFGGNTQTFNITSGDTTNGFIASAAGGGLELFLAAPVPEPGTLALIGIGLLAMALLPRRAVSSPLPMAAFA